MTRAASAPVSIAVTARLSRRLNSLFDRCNRCTLTLAGRPISSYQVCGLSGLTIGIALAFRLVHLRALAPWPIAFLALAGLATFLVLALVTKVLGSEEALIYYHHEICILGVSALLLRAFGQPVLPYLDVSILVIGTVLTFGRIGCFMVGCCNGRPCEIGVCYRREHAEAGFASYLVGARLLPIQLVEAAAVFVTVAVGVGYWLRHAEPGAVVVWYSVAYGAVRFLLEYVRGDSSRPYLGALSEAQWTTLVILGLIALAAKTGHLPVRPWHLVVSGGVFVAAAVSLVRGSRERRLFLAPHLCEIARLLEAAGDRSRSVGVSHTATTSRGILVSAHTLREGEADLQLWSLSAPRLELRAESLERLTAAVARLRGLDDFRWQPAAGVYHLIHAVAGGARGV